MEDLFPLQSVRIEIIIFNFEYWIDVIDTLKLLSTCKKLWSYRKRNEHWLQVFEKNTEDIMFKRKKLTGHQCLT